LLTAERSVDPVLKLPEPFLRNHEPKEVFELS